MDLSHTGNTLLYADNSMSLLEDHALQALCSAFANLNLDSPDSPSNIESTTPCFPTDSNPSAPSSDDRNEIQGSASDMGFSHIGNTVPYGDNSTSYVELEKSYGKSLQPSREEEDRVIGNDPDTFEDLHPKMTQGIVPQQELKTLNCQPSSVDTNEMHSSSIPNRFLQGRAQESNRNTQTHVDNSTTSNLELERSYGISLPPSREDEDIIIDYSDTFEDIHQQRSSVDTNQIHSSSIPYEFRQGNVLTGTSQSLLCFIDEISRNHSELAICSHGILTTMNNQPTELGKYEECVWSGKGYRFVEDVGSGSNGCVKSYRDNTTNVCFVKKQILEKVEVSWEMVAFYLNEVKILNELNHENIVKLYGFILKDTSPEILMENAGVSLVEYITTRSCPDVSEDKIIKITYQGVSGLEHLASKRIIHYDIKPENLCVLEKGSNIMLKITDFGSAKKEMEPPNLMGFTIGYESPELDNQLVKYLSSILNTDNCVMTTKSDIFSFALSIMFVYKKEDVVISFINNGKMSYKELRQAIFESLVANPSLVKDQLIPDACCSEMRIILRAMVEKDPQERPTARKIKRHMEDVFGRKILTNSMAVGTGFQQCGTS